jgi:Na+/glutamate symporter
MALVRRIDVMGSAAAPQPVAPQRNGQSAVATIPAQGPPAGADAQLSSVAQAVPAWAANAEAAAVASKGAGVGTVTIGFVFVALGAVVAYVLNRWGNHAAPFKIGNPTSAYAGIIVFAGAVERFLEPFTHWLPGSHAKNEYENMVAALTNGHPGVSLRDVAAAKAKMDRAQANRTVLLWSLATVGATVAAAASGFYLLHMIAAADWTTQLPDWVDALVTGLVVGTGTKPLHDLITRAQDGKGNG